MSKKTIIFLTLILSVNLAIALSANKVIKDVRNHIETGNLDAAESVIDSALVESPDDYKLLRVKGEILQQKMDYSGALDYFERALQQKSKDHEALYGAGMVSLKLDQAQKALEYFDRGLQTKKNKEKFLYGMALTQMQLGELAEADANIRKAINKDKKNPEFHKTLGNINFKKQVWSIALSEYNQSFQLDSSQTELYYVIAVSNKFMMNFTESAKNYRAYLDYFPQADSAWEDLAKMYKLSNNPGEAIFCYKKLTELQPNNSEIWFTLGELQYNIRDYEGGSVALEQAVTLGFNVAESYKMLAKIYQLRKEYFKADSAYTRFEQELGAPDDPVYWFDKGKVMEKIGQKDASFFDRAIQAFDKAIELDSMNASYWEHGGLARYYKQDYATAIPYFKKRIELGEEGVNALRNMAFCYLKTERYEMAAQTLEDAIELKPGDPVMSQMIGKIYVFLRKEADAIKHYLVALNDTTGTLSNGEKCKIKGDIGYCYVILRNPLQAIPMLEKAVKCDPKNIDYLYNLASSYHLDNKFELANEFYNKVLDINSNHKGAKEGAMRTTPR